MFMWLLFMGIGTFLSFTIALYGGIVDYQYASTHRKKLSYLIPEVLLLFCFLFWLILLVLSIYILQSQGW